MRVRERRLKTGGELERVDVAILVSSEPPFPTAHEVDLLSGRGAVCFRNADIGPGDRRIGAVLIDHLGGDPLILEEHFVPLQRDIL